MFIERNIRFFEPVQTVVVQFFFFKAVRLQLGTDIILMRNLWQLPSQHVHVFSPSYILSFNASLFLFIQFIAAAAVCVKTRTQRQSVNGHQSRTVSTVNCCHVYVVEVVRSSR